MARARAEYLSLTAGKSADKAAEAALEAFRDEERRQAFYRFFGELEDLYEILSPDRFLREFMDDYQRLADVYALLRSAYEGGKLTDRELARKTAYLVQERTQAGLIHETVAVYAITPQTLDHIAQSSQPDTVKVFNLLKSVEQKVEEGAAAAPYLLSIGERAEAIAAAFKQRQISTQEALKQLEELVREINEAAREQAERGIAGEPFAIFWLLKQAGVSAMAAEAVAAKMAEAFERFPHWRSSGRQAREVRRALYRHLETAGLRDVPAMAERLMAVLQRGWA
jgi:type I restriction enzyme R subunit